MREQELEFKAGNGGVVAAATDTGMITTTGGNDVLHLIPIGRTFFLTKIVWYQATGADLTFILGTLNNAAAPAFVPMLPTLLAITGIPGGLNKEDIPEVEWRVSNDVAPNGRSGNLIVVSSVAGLLISVEVAEKG